MPRLLIIMGIITAFGYLLGLELIPDRAEIRYVNPKFLRYMKGNVGRVGRRKPYAVNLYFWNVVDFDNNYTALLQLKEKMSSGQYHLTPLILDFRLCSFFHEEQFFGRMLSKHKNFTCPMPAGEHQYRNVVYDFLDNFPYHLPFAWAHQVSTQAMVDCSLYKTASREIVFNGSLYITITQKPNKQKRS